MPVMSSVDLLRTVRDELPMVPVSTLFRPDHDLSIKSGEKMKFQLFGEDTEVEKSIIDQIPDPLAHIFAMPAIMA